MQIINLAVLAATLATVGALPWFQDANGVWVANNAWWDDLNGGGLLLRGSFGWLHH
jgi:hypothetical protein